MNKDRTRPAKRGRPKSVKPRETAATAAQHCTYDVGGRPCGVPISKLEPFCIRHLQPAATVGEIVEREALGREAAAKLREELKVTETLETMPVSGNADAEAMRMVLESQGVAPEKRAPRRQAPPAPASADEQAQEMVWQYAVAEKQAMADRVKRRRARGSGEFAGTPETISASLHIPEMTDPTAMVDSQGKSLVKPGYKARWVSCRDMSGKGSSSKVDYFKRALGAEEVMGEDGKPYRSIFGDSHRAMQIPIERWAAYILKKSQTGAFDPSKRYAELAHQKADEINASVGRRAVGIVEMDEHGDKRWD